MNEIGERAGSARICRGESTFGSHLGGAAFRMVHALKKMKKSLLFRGDKLMSISESGLCYSIV